MRLNLCFLQHRDIIHQPDVAAVLHMVYWLSLSAVGILCLPCMLHDFRVRCAAMTWLPILCYTYFMSYQLCCWCAAFTVAETCHICRVHLFACCWNYCIITLLPLVGAATAVEFKSGSIMHHATAVPVREKNRFENCESSRQFAFVRYVDVTQWNQKCNSTFTY